MDKRLNKIISLLGTFASGDFTRRLSLSSRLDSTDAVINGIHMLGEELQATTISKNYFTNIFDSVSDMIFVMTRKGVISHCNRAAQECLAYGYHRIVGQTVEFLQPATHAVRTSWLLRELRAGRQPGSSHFCFLTSAGRVVPVDLKISYLLDNRKRTAILLTARDITHILETDNRILNAIIATQEKERQRLAKDVHDSIGQQMSAVKFFISALAETTTSKSQKKVLCKANGIIAGLQTELRRLCFNLMPKTLEDFGLEKAVRELCDQLSAGGRIRFQISGTLEGKMIGKDIETDAFRIIQEFISNSLTHSLASCISIQFSPGHEGCVHLLLADNGKGLPRQYKEPGGRGLHNINCRVRAHNGSFTIQSSPSEGTCFDISIPVS